MAQEQPEVQVPAAAAERLQVVEPIAVHAELAAAHVEQVAGAAAARAAVSAQRDAVAEPEPVYEPAADVAAADEMAAAHEQAPPDAQAVAPDAHKEADTGVAVPDEVLHAPHESHSARD